MKSFTEIQTEDRRLTLLILLQRSGEYTANIYLLGSALASMGHSVSQDRISSDLHWLAEQGLVTIDNPGELLVATLTTRGQDVANGHTTVPGVKRPGPNR